MIVQDPLPSIWSHLACSTLNGFTKLPGSATALRLSVFTALMDPSTSWTSKRSASLGAFTLQTCPFKPDGQWWVKSKICSKLANTCSSSFRKEKEYRGRSLRPCNWSISSLLDPFASKYTKRSWSCHLETRCFFEAIDLCYVSFLWQSVFFRGILLLMFLASTKTPTSISSTKPLSPDCVILDDNDTNIQVAAKHLGSCASSWPGPIHTWGYHGLNTTPTSTRPQNTKEHESVSASHLQTRLRSDFSLPVCNRSQIRKFGQRMHRSKKRCATKHATPAWYSSIIPWAPRLFHTFTRIWKHHRNRSMMTNQDCNDQSIKHASNNKSVAGLAVLCQATIQWRRAHQILDHNPRSQRKFFHIFLLTGFWFTEIALLWDSQLENADSVDVIP